ncbi:hypothetical protein B5G00_02035 [Blautia sp. An46]|nr:hypothetical protein B5G00_02035 [Blautia sp. An46]
MYVYPEELLPGTLGLYRGLLWAVRRKAESGGEVFFLIGAMANDQIYNYVSDYMDGVITREQFWVLAKFKYPTHQITLSVQGAFGPLYTEGNFCTKEALQCLKYRGYEEVK